ncbi:MAG: hypothetical protein ACO3SP_08515, partial [Ilumatobacteraceae bacterium]
VSLRTVRRLVGAGSLVVVFPGVLRSATWPLGRHQLMTAGCLRNPGSALAFTTAGQIHGLRKMHDDRVHFLLPHGRSPNLPGVIVHRCRQVDANDVIDIGDGLRVTSVARTLFDVGAVIGRHRLLSALDHALDKHLVTLAQVSETTLRLFHKRRPGSQEIKYALATRSSWSSAVQSDLEMRVLRAIHRHGLPTPRVQHELTVPGGTTIRFDFAWPMVLVGLEVDHSFWHAGSAESRRDKRRDRLAAQEGWITIRITEDDVVAGLDGVMEELSEVISRRTRASLRS